MWFVVSSVMLCVYGDIGTVKMGVCRSPERMGRRERCRLRGVPWTYQSGAMRIETSVSSSTSQTVCEAGLVCKVAVFTRVVDGYRLSG